MNTLLRAREITGRPVVTLAGDDIAQVKDVVFDAQDAGVRCFTLSGRDLLSGPLKRILLWKNVYALGPDAVMVRDQSALTEDSAAVADAGAGGGDVLGAQAMSDDGLALGKISDVIVEIEEGDTARVVGYEIESAGALWEPRQHVLLPMPRPAAVSRERVVVPSVALQFTTGDLSGFREAARGLRARLLEDY
jgi:uncharacterized protein YrrD